MTVVVRTTGFQDYLDERAQIRALVFGPPGAGKTRSAAFWPRPIFLFAEKGQMAVADRGVPFMDVYTVKDMEDAIRRVQVEAMKRERQWDTVVLDTLDNYQRNVIQDYLRTNNKSAMSGWQDWGYLDGVMTQLIDKLQNLPMNVVVNCHVKETMEGEGDDKERVYSPKLKGDLRDQIAADFDFVGFMSVDYASKEGKRVLTRTIKWTPEPKYPFLKDRSGRLPLSTVVDFTDEDYGRLLAALIGGLDTLKESEVLETVGTDDPAVPAPVAPAAGGVVADASTVAAPRVVKQEAPKPAEAVAAPVPEAAPAPPVAAAVPETAPAVPETAPPVAPAASTVPVAAKPVVANVPVATKPGPAPVAAPEPAAASSVPAAEPENTATTDVLAPQPEAAGTDDAQVDTEAAVAAVQEGLGGEVVSDTQPADETTHEAQAGPAVVEAAPLAVVPEGVPKSFIDYNCGEQPASKLGQFPAAPGCGTALRNAGTTNDKLQITALKAHTLLCPACYLTFKQSA